MTTPQFGSDGRDRTTYTPFELLRTQGAPDYVLQFLDWNWLFTTYHADVVDGAINGYYLNGPGIEGLVKAALFENGMNPDTFEIFYNSEGDCCSIQFGSRLDTAIQTAEVAADMIKDRPKLLAAIAAARNQGFDDS
jgi:hypothetical protein